MSVISAQNVSRLGVYVISYTSMCS